MTRTISSLLKFWPFSLRATDVVNLLVLELRLFYCLVSVSPIYIINGPMQSYMYTIYGLLEA